MPIYRILKSSSNIQYVKISMGKSTHLLNTELSLPIQNNPKSFHSEKNQTPTEIFYKNRYNRATKTSRVADFLIGICHPQRRPSILIFFSGVCCIIFAQFFIHIFYRTNTDHKYKLVSKGQQESMFFTLLISDNS